MLKIDLDSIVNRGFCVVAALFAECANCTFRLISRLEELFDSTHPTHSPSSYNSEISASGIPICCEATRLRAKRVFLFFP